MRVFHLQPIRKQLMIYLETLKVLVRGGLFIYALIDDDNEESIFPTITDDIIEDEELTLGIFDNKKNSFRVKPAEVGKHRERRLSRVQRGTEKSASKMDGLTIKWGINLH